MTQGSGEGEGGGGVRAIRCLHESSFQLALHAHNDDALTALCTYDIFIPMETAEPADVLSIYSTT